MTNEELIVSKLDNIQRRIIAIQEYIEDTQLTEDDLIALDEAEEEHRQEKTISHERLKKELSLDV
jgi:hypothetical protein